MYLDFGIFSPPSQGAYLFGHKIWVPRFPKVVPAIRATGLSCQIAHRMIVPMKQLPRCSARISGRPVKTSSCVKSSRIAGVFLVDGRGVATIRVASFATPCVM